MAAQQTDIIPDFKQMGIWGADSRLTDLFRRVFAVLRFPAHMSSSLALSPVGGVLLHGCDGCSAEPIAERLAKYVSKRGSKKTRVDPSKSQEFVIDLRNMIEEAEKPEYKEKPAEPVFVILADLHEIYSFDASSIPVLEGLIRQLIITEGIVVLATTTRKDVLPQSLLNLFDWKIDVSLYSVRKEDTE